LGFLGPGDLSLQVEHALGFAAALAAARNPTGIPTDDREPGSVLDLGSGGGLPGLVLAERWPATSFVLLDANERRTAFLGTAVEGLGLDRRVIVRRGRAEEAGRQTELRGVFDVVTARSFGPPPVTAECAAPFLRPGGFLVVSEPPPGPDSLGTISPAAGPDGLPTRSTRWPAGPLAELGLEDLGAFGTPFGFRVLRQVTPCPDRFPRRVGVPAKRPLYAVPEPVRPAKSPG
jgi:16S rRNA (guanine527-N7)-methyltransferase